MMKLCTGTFEKPSGEKEMIVQNLKDNTTY